MVYDSTRISCVARSVEIQRQPRLLKLETSYRYNLTAIFLDPLFGIITIDLNTLEEM